MQSEAVLTGPSGGGEWFRALISQSPGLLFAIGKVVRNRIPASEAAVAGPAYIRSAEARQDAGRALGAGSWLTLCAAILVWKLFLPGFIGMADNGDFGKVAGPLCLASAEPGNENFFHPLYLRTKVNCFQSHIVSSELILAGLASTLALNASETRPKPDIRWLGADDPRCPLSLVLRIRH